MVKGRPITTPRRCVIVALLACAGCGAGAVTTAKAGRISVRPHQPTRECTAGLHTLSVGASREAVLYVPEASRATWPLLVLLHGAGGSPGRIVERLRPAADALGVILLAPPSRAATWDGISGAPADDAVTVGNAMNAAYDRCVIGPSLAVGGFSDGASYALTLGIANGDVFTHVIAFSPCLISSGITPAGKPFIFISHGREDDILPFERCGEALAKRLTAAGYRTRFEPFIGPHTVPPEIATRAFGWFLQPTGSKQ